MDNVHYSEAMTTKTNPTVTETFETKLCVSCWQVQEHSMLKLSIPGASVEIICPCGHVTNR